MPNEEYLTWVEYADQAIDSVVKVSNQYDRQLNPAAIVKILSNLKARIVELEAWIEKEQDDA